MHYNCQPKLEELYVSIITGPPNFKVEPQDTVVESGDTVTMNCVVEGEPEPEITWRKCGPVLENGTDRITILQNQSLRWKLFSYVFIDIVLDDYEVYSLSFKSL